MSGTREHVGRRAPGKREFWSGLCLAVSVLACLLASERAAAESEAGALVVAPVHDIFYEGAIVLDPEGELTPEAALARAEADANLPRRRVPPGGNAYWVVETVSNPGDVPTWWVEVFAARSDYIDLYVIADGSVEQHAPGGLIRQATQKRILKGMGSHVLPFTLPAGEARTLALRVQSRSLINYTIKVGPDYALNNDRVYRHVAVYALMGGMLFLILYNLFLGAALREPDYLLYSAHGVSYFVFFFNSYGFAASLLGWTAHPWITVYSGFCIELFGIAFVWRFLRVRGWSPVLSWLMIGAMALIGAAMAATYFVGYRTMSAVWMISYAIVPFFVLFAAGLGSVRRIRQSLYILLGWTPMVVMTLIAMIAMLGYLDRPPSGSVINASVVLEMLVLSLALADRVRTLRNDRARAITEGREKSTFLAILSHEVRTPLTGILGTVELLKETPLNKRQKKFVDSLSYSGKALLTLLNDVLQLSKYEAGAGELNQAPTNVAALAESIVTLMSPRAEEKGVSVSFEVSGDAPETVMADEARLRQVLLNLIGNAVKFTDKGKVSVRFHGRRVAGGRVSLRFEIEDEGIGFDEATKENLFKPFVQADSASSRAYEGSGLGLSISKELVELMGGTISARSAVGKGSCFSFEITTQEAPMPPPQAAVSRYPAAGRLHVLIVDDIELNREVIGDLMRSEGFRVSVAASGAEAMVAMEEGGFDALVLDAFMPGMSGLEVATRLRAAGERAPIIGMTAAVDAQLAKDCLEVGMDVVLNKPVQVETLSATIIELVEERRGGAAEPPLLNERTVRGYEDRLGVAKFSDLVGQFEQNAMELIDRLERETRSGDASGQARTSHQLAGSATMLGFEKLGRRAEAYSAALRDGKRASLEQDDVLELKRSLTAGVEALKGHLS